MHVLLTNDDGYQAPGLVALYRAVAGSHRVTVVAPSGQRSACGHSSTLGKPIQVTRLQHGSMGDVFSVDGTPADCVRLAVAELADDRIDCVLSGINRGSNVSVVDVAQSGTVAAVREATFCGIRGIALSQMFKKTFEPDWDWASQLVGRLLPQLLEIDLPRGSFWNVNLPCLASGSEPAGVRLLPASTEQIPLTYASDDDPGGKERRFTYRGIWEERTGTPGTDVAAVFGNEISVTPMRMDPTDTAVLGRDISFVI